MSGTLYAKAGAWSLVAHATQIVGSIAISVVVVRMLPMEVLGELTLGRQLMALLAVAGGLGLERAAVRFMPEWDRGGASGSSRGFLHASLGLRALAGLVVAAFAILFRERIAGTLGIVDPQVVGVAALGAFAFSFAAQLRAAANARFDARRVAQSTVVTLGLGIVGTLVALWRGEGVQALLTVGALAAVLGGVLLWTPAARGDGVGSFDRGRVVRYTLPFAFIILMNQIVHSQTEVFFLGRLRSPEEAAIFQYGFVFAQRIIDFLPLALWEVSMAAFARENAGDPAAMGRLVHRYLRLTYALILPIAFAGIALSPNLIEWFYGEKMAGAVFVSQAYFLIGALAAFGAPMGMVLYTQERIRLVLAIYVVGVIANMAADFVLVRAAGIGGALVGLTIGKAVIVGSMTWAVARSLAGYSIPVASIARALAACAPVLAWLFVAHRVEGVVGVIAGTLFSAVVLVFTYRWTGALAAADAALLESIGIPGSRAVLRWMVRDRGDVR